jgi:Ni,Fe-hydrogenase I cytochrome b subunit
MIQTNKHSTHREIYQIEVEYLNILKPSGFLTYHQVKHSKILYGARFALSVLSGSLNLFCIHHELLLFITVVESVYSAVRTDVLYKADYVSSWLNR